MTANNESFSRRRLRRLDDQPPQLPAPPPRRRAGEESDRTDQETRGPKLTPAQREQVIMLCGMHATIDSIQEALRTEHPDIPQVSDKTIREYRRKTSKRAILLMEQARDAALQQSVADARVRVTELVACFRRQRRRIANLDRLVGLDARTERDRQDPALLVWTKELTATEAAANATLRQIRDELQIVYASPELKAKLAGEILGDGSAEVSPETAEEFQAQVEDWIERRVEEEIAERDAEEFATSVYMSDEQRQQLVDLQRQYQAQRRQLFAAVDREYADA